MKRRNFLVKQIASDVQEKSRNLRREYPLNPSAEKELSSLQKDVTPELYGNLIQMLLGFHADMQLEMAENLVMFACQHIAHTTGCPSVDFILDVCYTWIATEHGILKPKFKKFLLNN